jgi:hypothetical protein
MEIGEPNREIVIEPLEDPVPREAPAPNEPVEPVPTPDEPERVPA